MKKTRLIIAVSVVVLLFGGIAVSDALGYWQTKGNKQPKKIQSGDFAGQYDPWDIRGSYTFGNIEENFDIEASVLASAFGIKDENPSEIQVKELEAIYENAGFPVEIGTSSVRYFVALYKGLPITDSEGITVQAVNILKEHEKISDTLYAELLKDAVDLDAEYTKVIKTDSDSEEEHESGNSITGSTTVGQALDMGIPEEVLKEYIGDITNRNAIVKDLVKAQDLSFSEVRTKLNEYLGE